MARARIENGFIQIPREIAEALAKTKLSQNESRLVWVVLRKTYGWHKDKDWISYSQFQKKTRRDRSNLNKAMKRLVKRHIVARSGNGYKVEYSIETDCSLWDKTDL